MLLAAALGIALAALATLTSPYARFASWSDELQQRLVARPANFPATVVFDVDDESIPRLENQLGDWPYAHDVYALVTNWLWRSGAQAVVFDIPFFEERAGDKAFAAALGRRAVLSAVPISSVIERRSSYLDRLKALGLPLNGVFASIGTGADLALPRPVLTPPGGARVGVVGFAGDASRFAGSLPLLHPVQGQVLPALPLAALLAAKGWPRLSLAEGELQAGDWRWPVTNAGEVRLRYPSNVRELTIIPFYRLALAAAGVPDQRSLAMQVRGRIVFVGSSGAMLADRVRTPAGPLAGLHHWALATELLAQGKVSRPASLGVDALLLALAAGLALAAAARGARARLRDHLAGAAGAVLLPCAAGLALFAGGAFSHWPFAILAGGLVEAVGAALWRLRIRRERKALQGDAGTGQGGAGIGVEFLERLVAALRTPLSGITAYNRVSQGAEDLSRDERLRIAGTIGRNCDQMLALLNDHVDLANVEAGRLAIERRPENPVGQVQQAIEATRAAAEKKGLTLSMEIVHAPPAMLALDAARLRQVLLILLANALEVSDRGNVVVGIDWDGEALLLDLRDTGRELPQDALRRTGEALQCRQDIADAAGSGAALALAGRLVRRMQGAISVGAILGEGNRVRVRIPAAVAAGADRAAPPRDAVVAPRDAVVAPGEAVLDVSPAVIRIDPLVRELVPRFLDMCKSDLAGMKSDLDAGNFDALRGTGHKLKGAGGSYGFDEITRIGAGIESAAKAAGGDELRQLIGDFERYLDRVQPVYD